MTHNTHFASDVAALRFRIALARLELKYREDQARLPKGRTGGGQFADEGRGRGTARGFVAPAVAAGRVTAAATVGAGAAAAEGMAAAAPGAAAMALGAVGISRTAGLATQAAQGGGVTPILGIPYQLSMPGKSIPSFRTQNPIDDDLPEQCQKAYQADINECYQALGLDRSKEYPRNTRLRQCYSNAADRLGDCISSGEPYGSDRPLLAGVTY